MLTPEVRDLLAAIRDAASPSDLDPAGMVQRLATIHVRVDGLLDTGRLDAGHPDLPPLLPRAMADATAALRELARAS